jgi:hypothetical protein
MPTSSTMSFESEHSGNELRQEGPKYSIYAPDTPEEVLERNPNIEIGNSIEYNEDNQEGYKKYRVISDGNGGKTVKEIDNYDKRNWRMEDGGEDEPDDLPELREELPEEEHLLKGGKTRRRKSHKRKTHKRKTHKRKTHKRKTHRRKSRK